jgi:hypothetical protein
MNSEQRYVVGFIRNGDNSVTTWDSGPFTDATPEGVTEVLNRAHNTRVAARSSHVVVAPVLGSDYGAVNLVGARVYRIEEITTPRFSAKAGL